MVHFMHPLLSEGRHYFFRKQVDRLPDMSHWHTADSMARAEDIHLDQILLLLKLPCDCLRATNGWTS